MTSLTSLIERIEAATEGSRELDILVGAAIDLRVDECDLSFRQSFEICGMEQMLRSAESHQNIWREALPRYSTSIDAALTLLPEGWRVAALGFIPADKFRAGWYCELVSLPENYCFVGLDDPMNFHPADPSRIATPALALLAAILLARQTEATHDES